MGGGASQTEQTSSNLANTEAGIAQQYLNLSQTQLAQGQALQQPLINFYKGVTSGDQNALLTAAAPQIGNITQQNEAAKASIWNNIPAGAGRDAALAQQKVGQAGQVANTLNTTYNSALTGLAQLGSGQQGVGLQEAGAGFTGVSGAQSAYGNVMQTQEQQKASTMGLIGSIVGGAAGVATGGLSGLGRSGGGIAGLGDFSAGPGLAPSSPLGSFLG